MNTKQTEQHAAEPSVETLLAEAGARPAVPGEAVEQIKAAAKAEWQKHYAGDGSAQAPVDTGSSVSTFEPAVAGSEYPSVPEQASAKGWLLAATLLAVSLAGGWWLSSRSVDDTGPPPALSLAGVVAQVVGQVDYAALGQGSAALTAGQDVTVGSSFQTASAEPGSPSPLVAVTLGSGHSVRLASGSRLRFLASDQVELLAGKLYVASESPAPMTVDHEPSAAGVESGIVVHTSLGSVRDIGTQFEVALIQAPDGEQVLRARVREGEIILRTRGEVEGSDQSASASAGEELVGLPSGAINRRSEIAVHGEEWQWVLAGATPFTVDGRSGNELLSWLGRETGREVVFLDQGAATAAASPIDAGAGQSVGPNEALNVLLTLGLSARYEGGTIVVGSQ